MMRTTSRKQNVSFNLIFQDTCTALCVNSSTDGGSGYFKGTHESAVHLLRRFLVVSHRSHGKEAGHVLVFGMGDVGQLGLGEDVLERKKPALVSLPEKIVQVVAGGMHTVCVSDSGNVRASSLSVLSHYMK